MQRILMLMLFKWALIIGISYAIRKAAEKSAE
jgi:hypothetical protein